MENKVLVAVSYDNDKKCKQVAKVGNLTDKQYKALLNEQHEHEQKEETFKHETKECEKEHDRKFAELNKVLAKSIYDNFVDRGLIENDDKFQDSWFDFYFNDKELDLEKAPYEYKKILAKVESL